VYVLVLRVGVLVLVFNWALRVSFLVLVLTLEIVFFWLHLTTSLYTCRRSLYSLHWWETSRHCLVSRQSRGSIFTVLVLVLTFIILVLVLPLLSCLVSRESRPRQFKTPVEKRLPTRQKPSWWQRTWQWSIVRTLTQMNSQPFIPSHNATVYGHSSPGYVVCLSALIKHRLCDHT